MQSRAAVDVLAGREVWARSPKADDPIPTATEVFLRLPESVSDARRFVAGVMADWQLPDLADDAELVASELASNAVQHARSGAFRITLHHVTADRVRLAVIDRSRVLPQLHSVGQDEGHGRGMAIVDTISQKWDVELLTWGKKVWVELESPTSLALPEPAVPLYASHRGQLLYVWIVLAVAAAVISGLVMGN